MATVGSLYVELRADIARLQRDLGRAVAISERRARQVQRIWRRAAGMMGAAFAASGFQQFVKTTIDSADKIQKFALRIGASTEALSQYQLVAERAGVSFETLTMGMQRMVRRISEAAQGTGEAKDALRELGLDARRLEQLRPSQQFEVLADALSRVKDSSDRVRLAMRLFDSEGVALLQTMQGGAEGIRKVREEADRLGLTLTEMQASRLAEVKDSIANLDAAYKGLATAITVKMAPALSGIANEMARAASESGILKAALVGLGGVIEAIFTDKFDTDNQKLRSLYVELKTLQRRLEEKKGNGLLHDLFFGDELEIQGKIDEVVAKISKLEEKIRAKAKKLKEDIANRSSPFGGMVDSLESDAARLREMLKTPFEKAADELDKYDEMLRRGLISMDEWAKATNMALRKIEEGFKKNDGLKKFNETFKDKTKKMRDEAEKLQRILDRLFPNQARARQFAEELALLKEKFGENSEEVRRLQEEFAKATGGPRKLAESMKKSAEEVSSFARDMGLTFSSAFEDAIVRGNKLRDVLRGLGQDIARITARKLITEPVGDAVAKFVSNLKIPGFAHGTSFAPGGLALVGEYGPEVVKLPRGSQVIPNDRLSLGGTVVINQSFDFSGANPATVQLLRQESARIVQAAVAAVQDAYNRRGKRGPMG